ncbi:MAG: FtsX-like permease family protein [Alphaproteobacteria bacterium]|nr:FtsX-like permease family protein [Alphaproteobacteria bacterium]
MIGPLNRKLVRDLWHIRGLVIAIASVIGAGVATFVMSIGMVQSLDETRTAYYERYRFADVFGAVKRAPEHLTRRLSEIDGVKTVATRIVKDVTLDIAGLNEPATGRLISVSTLGRQALNDIRIRRGRGISHGRPDDAVISEAFAEAHGFEPGDHFFATINGHRRRLDIVGIALSPEYVYSIAPAALMPDDKRFGVIWMSREALAAAFDMDGAFNDIAISLLRNAVPRAVIADIDRLLDPYGGTGAYLRRDQVSNWFLSSEIEQLRTMATLIPTIFLAVSAFLLNMVISRLVATEREQIGLLKAFGYTNAAIAWHYVKFILAMVALGLVLGSAAGAWLGRELTEIYTQFYRFPFLYFRLDGSVFAGAVLISLTAALIGGAGAVGRAIRLPPAEAMAPPAPPTYRRGLLQSLPIVKALDQPTRMILRHVSRWPVRSALTTLGIALALSLLLSSLFWLDAIEIMIDTQYEQAERQDITISLTEAQSRRAIHALSHAPGVTAVQPYRAVPIRLRYGHKSRLVTLTGAVPNASLNRVLDASGRAVSLPQEGLVLSANLADLIGAAPGDMVTVEVLEGRRPIRRLRIAETFETYLGTLAYMRIDALNRLLLEGPTISGAYILADPQMRKVLHRELKDIPKVAGVSLRETAINAFRDTIGDTMNVVVGFYVLFAGLLTFGVVYNSARISLSERGRELASLRVLGFTRFEVSYILLGELAALTVIALPLGCILGYGLCWIISSAAETELYRIPLYVDRTTFGFSIIVVLIAVIISGLIVRRRVDGLDLIAVLKTRE